MAERKRSGMVVLTLVGLPLAAVGLADAFPGQEVRRNVYADRPACERDYSPTLCAPSGDSSGTGSSGGWHGPYFYTNRSAPEAKADPGPGRGGTYIRSEVSTRGGFGAFGRALRAGS